ncbi:MAG: PIN/TRAM domain-containing protein [Planctomycetota bacterium]
MADSDHNDSPPRIESTSDRERSQRFTIYVLRAIFFASAVGIGVYISRVESTIDPFFSMIIAGALAGVVIIVEALSARSSIATVSAVVFGLIIGFLAANLFIGVVSLMGDFETKEGQAALRYIRLALTLVFCFLGVTYILRTKDDVRFIVPYVEFQKRVKGPRPLILDTSALIDGRIVDLAAKNLFDAPVVVPRFVIEELQKVADSGDKTRRARGRRGLDRLKALQELPQIEFELSETTVPLVEKVDGKLVELTRSRDGRLVTVDFNLVKVCAVEKVEVLNLNDLAQAFRAPAIPGDRIVLKVVRPGESAAQGVGYLEDGTMVVIDGAREKQGQEVPLVITSSIQTSAGRMLFGRMEEAAPAPAAAEKKEEPKPA